MFSSYDGLEVSSAGTSDDAETPIAYDLIEWADIIFVMENIHRTRLNQKFGSLLRSKRVVVLDIPDNYKYMDPELIRVLEQKVSRHLPEIDFRS